MMRWFCLVVCLVCVPLSGAQEGHPLAGTWSGDWGPGADDRTYVTIVMFWDGSTVTGILNPGPQSTSIKAVTFEPSDWRVRFEVDIEDETGNPVTYAVQGTLENYGSLYRQEIVGSWSRPGARGDFKLNLQ